MSPRAADIRHLPLLILTLAALTTPIAGRAAILNVPSTYATISAALTAASAGDTIRLADGTYTAAGDLTLRIAKSVTIDSVNGAASTIVDCGGFGQFVSSTSGSLTHTIEGLTIRNPSNDALAFNSPSSAVFNSCVFSGLSGVTGISGATNLTITGCDFSGNTASELIQINNSLGTVSVSNTSFTNDSGISIYNNGTNGILSNCTFTNDGSPSGNGPIVWLNGPLTITDTAFSGNKSNGGGGAILIDSAGINTPLTLHRCTFAGNSTSGGIGGAIWLFEGDHNIAFTADDCVFRDNSSDTDGSAIGASSGIASGSISLTNCTFHGNSGSATGQGTLCGDSVTPLTLKNTILYGDTTPKEISTANTFSSTTVTHSDIHQAGFAGSNGNINQDPLFNNAAGNDFHIPPTSPCAGTGTTTGAPATDFNQYTYGTTASMGAFAPIEFLISSATPISVGSTTSTTVTASAVDGATTVTNYSGTVHFTSNDTLASLPTDTTLSSGTGTFSPTLNTVGSETISVIDASEAAYVGTSNSVTVTAAGTSTAVTTSDNPAVYGASTTLTATVTPASGPAPGGSVQFKVDGSLFGGANTVTAGVAQLSTSALPVGKHQVVAVYTPDANHTGSQSPAFTQYTFDNDTVLLTPSVNPSYFSQSVTFTAHVNATAGTGTPVGRVQFFAAGQAVGSPVTLNGAGSATYSTSTLPTGTTTLYARYEGDSSHRASLSAPLRQSVGRVATATDLQTSGSPSIQGQFVTFSARVTSTVAFPPGSVQFKLDGVNMGAPIATVSGLAQYVTKGIPTGSHAVTAVYLGTGVYVSSTSNPVTQVVN